MVNRELSVFLLTNGLHRVDSITWCYHRREAILDYINTVLVKAHLEWEKGRPSEEEEICFQRVHLLLKTILQVIPMYVSFDFVH